MRINRSFTQKLLITTLLKLLATNVAAGYLPFGLGGLFPLPPPDGLPVVLGAFFGADVFAILLILHQSGIELTGVKNQLVCQI